MKSEHRIEGDAQRAFSTVPVMENPCNLHPHDSNDDCVTCADHEDCPHAPGHQDNMDDAPDWRVVMFQCKYAACDVELASDMDYCSLGCFHLATGVVSSVSNRRALEIARAR